MQSVPPFVRRRRRRCERRRRRRHRRPRRRRSHPRHHHRHRGTEPINRRMADSARCLGIRQPSDMAVTPTAAATPTRPCSRSRTARTSATQTRSASHTRGSVPTPTATFSTPRLCQISTRWLAADRSPRRKGTRAPIATSRTRRPRRRTTLYSAASGSAPADGRALALAAPASPCLSLWPSAPRRWHWPRSPTEASAGTPSTF